MWESAPCDLRLIQSQSTESSSLSTWPQVHKLRETQTSEPSLASQVPDNYMKINIVNVTRPFLVFTWSKQKNRSQVMTLQKCALHPADCHLIFLIPMCNRLDIQDSLNSAIDLMGANTTNMSNDNHEEIVRHKYYYLRYINNSFRKCITIC